MKINKATILMAYFFTSFAIAYGQPIANWTCGEMSGGSLIDRSGNNNNGQIIGAIWQNNSGLRGLSFNGTNQYVKVPHNSAFNLGTDDFTIEVQFKTSVIPSGSWVALISKHNSATWHDREFNLSIAGTTGKMTFSLSTEDGVFETAMGTTNVCDGIYHRARAIRQGGQIKLYVDGKLEGTAAASINVNNTNDINIGRSFYDNGYGYFNGIITHVALWKNATAITSALITNTQKPVTMALRNNYPNPFNPNTVIEYDIPEKSFAELRIYDLAGRLVRSLVSMEHTAGVYRVSWDGRNDEGLSVASGSYIFTLKMGNNIHTKKAILLK